MGRSSICQATPMLTTSCVKARHDLLAMCLQARPQEYLHDAPDVLAKKSWLSESQAPSQVERQSTSVAADEGQHEPNATHSDLQVTTLV